MRIITWSTPPSVGFPACRFFFDDDGQVYYHWCHPGFPGGNIVQVLIDPATGRFLTEPQAISPGIGEGGAEGWPVVNAGRDLELEMEGPLPDPHPWPETPVRDDFDNNGIGPDWAFRRNPVPGSWSLSETPGTLTLHGGSAALSDPTGNVLIGRRQQHHFLEAATELDFEPPSPNEETGLSAFMDEHYFSVIGVRGSEKGGREAFLRRRVGACLEVDVATAPLRPGAVTLKIRAERRWYRFGFEQEGKTKWLGWAETHHHSTEIAWGWTGVLLCLHASGNGKPARTPARFHWFDYRPAPDQSFTPDMPDRFALVPPGD